MQSIIALLGDPTPFLTSVFQHLAKDRIDVSRFELDHICYRVETLERYAVLKNALMAWGTLLTESMIQGRPIATFELHTPLQFKDRSIQLLELPAPKAGRFYPEGYEHVEFVIDTSLAAFVQAYPHLTFDQSALLKPINPDVSIGYPDCQVKFHEHSLAYVIRYLD